MNIFKIEDLKGIQARQAYKYVCLTDQSGNKVIIPFNTNKIPIADRLQEIETRLTSQGLKDGYYNVKFKNTTSKTVSTDDYMIYKGEHLECGPEPAPVIIEKPSYSPEVLTYDQALKLNIEVERLKLENNSLKKEIVSLKAEIQELETSASLLSENEEPAPSLMENAQTFLTNAMGFIAPLLDKHFELKEKKLGLDAIALQSRLDSMNKNPFATAQQPAKQTNAIKFEQTEIEDFIRTFDEDPEVYESLAAIYNSSTSLEEFLKTLKSQDPEKFNALLLWKKN